MDLEYLPAGFCFTQTALRTYQICPYRFRLRYLDRIPWPAFPPNPTAEAAIERGRRFHELVRQHLLGLDVSDQVEAADESLSSWWASLQAAMPDLSAYGQCYPEAGLSVPLGRYRLAARYDLLAVGDEAALVVDWKTGRGLPPADILAGDVQTRVYLYVLAEGGATYHGGRPFSPETLRFLYWHPQGPQQVWFDYSVAQQEQDRLFIEALVGEIAGRPPEDMPRVRTESACGDCAYASLCGRPGGEAWEWEPEESITEVEGWPGI